MATGKNMLERNDINTTEALECPGCHRRYRRADFKSDRLTCPACGREVVALATVEEVDKADREKIIRKYIMGPIDGLDGWRGKIGCTGMVVLGVLFFVLIDSTFGTLAFIALSWFFMRLLSRERKVRHHILSLFENVDFDVEKGFAAHREYIKTVKGKSWLGYGLRSGLERNLHAQLAAAATVKTTYQVPSGHGKSPGRLSDSVQILRGGDVPQEEFDFPPEDCPFCHAPYRVADFAGKSVTCRRCGGRVRIRHAVDESEIRSLTQEYLDRLIKREKSDRKETRGCVVLGIVISGICLYFSDSLVSFLLGWPVLFVYLSILMVICWRQDRAKHRERTRLLEKKDFSLFDLEYAMKKDSLSEDERLLFDRFKDELINLYRSDSGIVKGKVFS